MSYDQEEFDRLKEAFESGERGKKLRELIESSDPETVSAFEKYVGRNLTSGKFIGKGQGKMKNYAEKKHSSKFHKKQAKIFLKKGNERGSKIHQSLSKIASIREKKGKLSKDITEAVKKRDNLQRVLRRRGVSITKQTRLPDRKGKH
jgi:hypothetical protein